MPLWLAVVVEVKVALELPAFAVPVNRMAAMVEPAAEPVGKPVV